MEAIIFDYLLTLDEKLISVANHKLMRKAIFITLLVQFSLIFFEVYVIISRGTSFLVVIFPSVCISATVSWYCFK